MVTIKDISRLANVSTAAVSKVVNGDYSKVSEATRDRILKAIKDTNYRPNRLARGLVKNQTHILGLIVSDITNPFFAELARGVEDKAGLLGYNVILCNTDDDPKKEAAYTEVLTQYNVDGVIITGSESPENQHILQLRERNIKFASIDRYVDDQTCSVFLDNAKGSYMATEHIIRKGHSCIAFIGGESDARMPNHRLRGYIQALEDNNINRADGLIRTGSYHMASGYANAMELLESKMPFTAMVCGNDLIAIGAIKALREKGIRIPQDVAVTGYDDTYLASMIDPGLTTIKQPIYEMGSYAVEILVKLLHNEVPGDRTRYFTPQLVIRGSV